MTAWAIVFATFVWMSWMGSNAKAGWAAVFAWIFVFMYTLRDVFDLIEYLAL